MLYSIQNDQLTVIVNTLGAELWSLKSLDGTEYLWQGDPAFWAGRAPTLFPFVGRQWQGCYSLDGQTYSIPIHGFAKTLAFSLVEQSETSVALELQDNEESYAQYPRHFRFCVTYSLDKDTLTITYEVENLDTRTMYFAIGGHPGFNVPLDEGKAFEDYRLRFSAPCKPSQILFSNTGCVTSENTPFLLDEDQYLPLQHELFDSNGIFLHNIEREVTLESPGSSRSVTVSFPDMPYIGFWQIARKEAPYVCIEPWSALPADDGQFAVLEQNKRMIALSAGDCFASYWTIKVRE